MKNGSKEIGRVFAPLGDWDEEQLRDWR